MTTTTYICACIVRYKAFGNYDGMTRRQQLHITRKSVVAHVQHTCFPEFLDEIRIELFKAGCFMSSWVSERCDNISFLKLF